MSENQKKIKSMFLYPENYRIENISGAFGGFNASGDYLINFYFEYPELPRSSDIYIEENGIRNEAYPPSDAVTRVVKCGVSMNLQTMINIRDWLTVNISELEVSNLKEEEK